MQPGNRACRAAPVSGGPPPAAYEKLAASRTGIPRAYYRFCGASALEARGERRGATTAFAALAKQYRGSQLAVLAADRAGLVD